MALATAYLEAQAHGAGDALSPALVDGLRAVVVRAPAIALFAGLFGRAMTIAPLMRAEARAYCVADGADAPGEDDDGSGP